MVTLIDLKKAKMTALKEHNSNAQSVLGLVISAYQKMQIDKQGKGQTMTDADMVSILNKTLKELTEEKEMYEANGRTEQAETDAIQMEIIKSYLPKMMSEDEIRAVIDKLEDHSIKSIMTEFKANYAGKADMGLVSRIAKEYQK